MAIICAHCDFSANRRKSYATGVKYLNDVHLQYEKTYTKTIFIHRTSSLHFLPWNIYIFLLFSQISFPTRNVTRCQKMSLVISDTDLWCSQQTSDVLYIPKNVRIAWGEPLGSQSHIPKWNTKKKNKKWWQNVGHSAFSRMKNSKWNNMK